MNVHVMKRDGSTVAFDRSRIERAILAAFMDPAVLGPDAGTSASVRDKIKAYTDKVLAKIESRPAAVVAVEDIQDLVESVLMDAGEHKVAREYIRFRDLQAEQRKAAGHDVSAPSSTTSTIRLKKPDGSLEPLDRKALEALVAEAAEGLDEGVDSGTIVNDAIKALFDGAPASALDDALILSAKQRIEQEPDYTYVAARFLLDLLRREVLPGLGLSNVDTQANMGLLYPEVLRRGLKRGVDAGMIDPALLDQFNLGKLGAAIDPHRDFQFTYLGLQTLYDRYFQHEDGERYELPQTFFMRVAMGLALNEDDPTDRAIEFYQVLSSFDAMSSTPTLFNSGTVRSQLSSCYLTSVPDDLFGIYSAIRDNAMLSKFAGGLGNDWTPVRGIGSLIKGTNGKSQGVVPFLKVANDTAVAVNQGGRRKGAACAYLETWHRDIEEFLELRKNTGDDRRRCHDMNTANWVPDLFMERVAQDAEWTLFSPADCPDLHDKFGQAFREAYEAYERDADAGKIRNFKRIPAKQLWRKMLTMLFETGHPWITFKDPCNLRSPQQHAGVVHSSNLCTEITLNTSPGDEIAVCNLASINIANHLTEDGSIDRSKLAVTVKTVMRMLDNVIDLNYYSVDEARQANMRHRPVGMGLMGFQDALYVKSLPYASREAVVFADELMELISYYAIEASAGLAGERGAYQSFQGSLWSQGVLPIDSIDLLRQGRGGMLDMDEGSVAGLDWDSLRETVKTGMRNSNVMAIAPTATIANITGVTQSIEPTYAHLQVKSNLSGEFTVINPSLVHELKRRGLWDKVMVQDLKYYDGSVQAIDRIPEDMKAVYACAFEIDSKWLIEAASRRQKWIDQAQSLNLYMAKASGPKLAELYEFAWKKGLKTTYYLRSMGATSTEKSTITDHRLNAVQQAPQAKVCSIDDPDCQSCQ